MLSNLGVKISCLAFRLGNEHHLYIHNAGGNLSVPILMIFIVCRDHVPRGYVGVSWQNIYINTTDSQFLKALLTSNFSFTTGFQLHICSEVVVRKSVV